MVHEKIENEEFDLDDVPPRIWWLAWRKLLREACLGIIGLHCAWLIYVRLAEPAAIQSLRRPGVEVQLEYDRLGQTPVFIEPYFRLRNAFRARRNEDVHSIVFSDHLTTDADLELIARSFPNLAILHLQGQGFAPQSLRQICSCSKLESLQVGDAALDLETIQQLLRLTNLYYHSRLELYERKLDLIFKEDQEMTQPGVYEFTLDNRRYGGVTLNMSTINLPFTKTFYFRFTESKRFCAQLEHAGSNAVMLSFMGGDEDRTHRARQDARQGEHLKISADISQADIETLGDHYWKLKVANYSYDRDARCKMTITIEDPES